MDKNKSRTDLLAAGRKKLQQYRQKKDGKGSSSHGKSSKKSSKSEQHESDADTLNATALPQVLQGEKENNLDSDVGVIVSALSHSTEDSVVPDANIMPIDPLPILITPESSLADNTNMDKEAVEVYEDVVDSLNPNVGESINVSAPPARVEIRYDNIVTDEVESRNREEDSFPSQEDSPDMSLTHARGDQVTDVGAMQEDDVLGLKQFGADHVMALERDGRTALTEQGDGSASASAMDVLDGFQGSTMSSPVADGTFGVVHEVANQPGEVDHVGASNAEDSETLSETGHFGENKKDSQANRTVEACKLQHMPEESFIFVDKSHEDSLFTKLPNSNDECTACSPADVRPISFSQLIEAIKQLNEDEYKLLLLSRESTGSSMSLQHDPPVLLEKLSEELFLTSCVKDILHLQLTEQSNLQTEYDHQFQQLDGEISVLRVSFNEARDKCDSLAEELAECRSELQASISGREELLLQFHAAKAEVEEVSTRANKLHNSLERSQSDLLTLSKESADSKDLVGTLHAENENLNQIIALLTEEKKKLVDEKNACLSENEKLKKELADCKNRVAALQVESSNLSGTLASVTADCKKFEKEKESCANGNEKLSIELSDFKDLMESLQVENVNLRVELAIATEDRMKLEEDKDYSVHEMERLSSELLVLRERLTKDHGDFKQLEFELKEVITRLEQLTEENMFLKSSLEIHKAKIKEINDMQAQRSSVGEAQNKVGILELQSRGCESEAVYDQSHEKHGKQDAEATEKSLHDAFSGVPPHKSFELEVLDDSLGFVVLKGRLEEGEKVLQKLEKGIEDMNSHAGFLSRSSSKVAAPAVSKLIQAFESKTHHEEHDTEEAALTEDRSSLADPFASTKEHAGNLKAVLKQLALDAVNASLLFKAERDGTDAANVTIKELKFQFEAMERHTDNLEATNIQFGVLYEAMKQHVFVVNEKNEELEGLYEILKQQNSNLKAENSELLEKLSICELQINDMQSNFNDLRLSSDELASVLRGQLENLQEEAADRVVEAEKEWNSTVAQIIEAVKRLDDSTGFPASPIITSGGHGSADISSHATSSINAAIKTIEDLKEKLEVASSDHEATLNLLKEVNEKYSELLGKNVLTSGTLDRLYCDLRKLVIDLCSSEGGNEIGLQDEKLLDPADYNIYKTLTEQLENALAERLQLQSVNRKLNLDLMSRTEDVEELNRRCSDIRSIEKLIEYVEGVVKVEDSEVDLDGPPITRLQSLLSSLVRKYKEADERVSSSKVEELTELREKIHQLTALKLQQETEILLLKEHLGQVEGALSHMQSELQEKLSELEQSEQKVASVREKLGIAVAKGKGLVKQRDSLTRSLSERSSELERCSQELQLKDARMNELETKLKTFSEAGERVEALESELSYIRNSATALRESFLLKDSVLQRIEEILEDLDLPEHFHSRDIIEKVDWLARSATGNSLPPADLDQKGSVGGSYSDAGFVMMDAWKEDVQPSSNSGDDLRRKYEDLQGKFYGLAEQNEMLEQSLMERNQLVQRWEELLDRIDMPAHLRSVEPEDRIEWLGSAFSEANHDKNSLLQNIGKLEDHCGSLAADLEESQKRISSLNAELKESQKRISDLEKDIQAVIQEKENLSERVEILNWDHEKLSAKAVQLAFNNENLQNEVTDLQNQLVQKLGNEEHIQRIDGEICRLQDLVCDALKDPGVKDSKSGGDNIECLEGLLMKLVEKCTTPSVEEHHAEEADADFYKGRTRAIQDDLVSDVALLKRDVVDSAEPNVDVLKKQLEETLSELIYVKEERDSYMEKQQSLVCAVEALERQRVELQELLSQEEQKSTSLREKLNVAVRKGKSLVQQRDSLKKMTEELTTELEHLKSEIKHCENALTDYKLKMRDLTSFSERVEALESENLVMRNRMAENDSILREKEHILSMILNALGDFDVGGEIYNSDPIKKLEHVGKLCRDLHAAVASSEEESRKSRRAAELLLAELNEVQDRNDNLQDELAKVTAELTQLSKGRDVAEAAKFEALSRFEKLSLVRTEEKNKRNSELVLLKSAANQLRKSFFDITVLLSAFFSEDLEFLQNLESGVVSCLQTVEADHGVQMPLFSASDGITSSPSQNKVNFMAVDFSSVTTVTDHFDDDFIIEVCKFLQEVIKQIAAINVILHEHSVTFHQQANNVSKLMVSIQRGITSQKESFETMQRDIKLKESAGIEKDMEIVVLRRNMALLYEACSSSLMEIENRRSEFANSLTLGDQGMNLKPSTFGDGGLHFGGESNFSSEQHVKDIAEKLLLSVKQFASLKCEITEGDNKEMKIIISNLQKELQEKDIQREMICKDLVSQIKQAEAAATSCSINLQSTKSHVKDLEKKVEMIKDERDLLQQKVKELQDQKTTSTELQEKVKSLTDILSAKDQEIEALMQALDEEEVQMEYLTKRVDELEKVVQQKNLDVENLEASRGKAVKKLSITVSKFDELHHFSESLLAEVEKLQSQLQDRDGEISFLRQEVTRCTNDAIVASQTSNKRNSDEICELLTWLATLVSVDVNLHDSSQVHECKEIIRKKITLIMSELEDLRVAAQTRDALLQMERSKVEDLTRREENLQKSLREKESQLDMLAVAGELGQPTSSNSEIIEVEPVINKWTVSGPSTASQVRSLRKVNNDQVAIDIDKDRRGSSRLEDEDDEKVHGFKSLTTSRVVPKFTRPVTDMIDGLWVSCDRALMRQPGLRLGIMIYWALLHALLATFVV
ncbi:trans-Golgi network-localized SYP41-interacting protein 1 isoform X4 [Ricinus communis]|uniref:trans-Golgi network-localized SYP41-interacting protein 1 isoform X4 n=2 Tax=Ricinus communis TaxID=3988 RepID=UPI00201AC7E1|nr:trans-Golgi network-localized SYP41-interacting protein 1 isoform X4 [Ricinus communis]